MVLRIRKRALKIMKYTAKIIGKGKNLLFVLAMLTLASGNIFAQSQATGTEDNTFLPRFALKTNLLYTATTLTPNLSFEMAIGEKSTLELSGSYSWIGRTSPASDNHKQRLHLIIRPEYRRWLDRSFSGHFFGAHAIYTQYNVSGHNVPLLFKKENRYEGQGYGLGATYGYKWNFSKQWGLEFNVGLGYLYMDYDKFTCAKCDVNGTSQTKHYFGPTRAGISLSYTF